jgi:hypothetical protein
MAKKYVEAELILKNLPIEQLSALHQLRGDAKIFESFKKFLTDLLYIDEGKILGLAGTAKTVDETVEKMIRQNYYKGRTNMLVLIHALLINAEKEINRREKKV